MKSRISSLTVLVMLAVALLLAGCAKKPVAAKVQAPPPPTPEPTVTLSVSPADITPGQSANLTWETQNATEVTLESIGSVEANGSKAVTPSQSTTYRIVAKGPGGSSDATARLTVNAPPAPVAAVASPSLRDLFERNMKDAYFAYDSYNLDNETSQMLASNAKFLQEHPEVKFTVEGHCDERGSEEYNLALGASRAEAVKQALVAQGVNGQRVATNSVGKEKPFCTDSNEECWHQNRRGHFVGPE